MTTKNWKLTPVFVCLAVNSSFQHPVRRTFTNYNSGITGHSISDAALASIAVTASM